MHLCGINQVVMSETLDNIKAKAGRAVRRTLWISALLLLVSATGFFLWSNYTRSDGTRVGTLFKISRVGIVFKTYEGQLHLTGSAMMTSQSTWNFSVADARTYYELQQLEGKSVKCYYKEKINAMPWQGKTNYIVYKVEMMQ